MPKDDPSSSSSTSTSAGWIVITTIIILLFFTLRSLLLSTSTSSTSTSFPSIPVFINGGIEGQKLAFSVLRRVMEDYRKELSLRMKAMDMMINENFPGWSSQGQAALPSLTKKLQEKVGKDLSKIPAFWSVNEEVLDILLRPPLFTQALPPSSFSLINPSESLEGENGSDNSTSFDSSNNRTKPSGTSTSTNTYNDAVQVITHLLRDWTIEGRKLREDTYAPILRLGKRLLSSAPGSKILLPGSGLGRLAFEISRLGHSVTSLDVSPVMISAAFTLLNWPIDHPPHVFHPYLHDPLINQRNHQSKFTAAFFPDIVPRSLYRSMPATSSLSLELGDFIALAQHTQWIGSMDCIITCYFIDTAPNPLNYLWAIRSILRDKGYWINLGPLNYHQTLPSGGVHLTLEELEETASMMGLEIIPSGEPDPKPCCYRPESFPSALREDKYVPSLTVARKV